MKKLLTHWTTAFITLFVLTYIGLQDPSLKEILRLKSFDYLLANEPATPSQDITIITIDEEAIEKYGQWPWPRNVLADLIVNLRQAQTGVIVMPILFSEEDRFGHDEEFCITLGYGTVIAQTGTAQKRTSNPVPRGVAKIGNPLDFLFEWDGMLGPLPELAKCTQGVGVINTAPEIDGVVRRVPLLMKIGENVYPNMAIETIPKGSLTDIFDKQPEEIPASDRYNLPKSDTSNNYIVDPVTRISEKLLNDNSIIKIIKDKGGSIQGEGRKFFINRIMNKYKVSIRIANEALNNVLANVTNK